MMTLVAALTTAVLSQTPPVNPRAAALFEFSKRLEAYLAMRAEIGRRLEPIAQTASAIELQARQDALAAALRKARSGAKQGDVIPPEMQQQIRQAVRADFRKRNPETKRAALAEVPTGPLPGINQNYPDRAALPTVPPLLLANLPPLPDNLQYRFFGRHVVILDGDVEIVVDYVPNALPR